MATTSPLSIAARLREDIDSGVWQAGAPLRQEELGIRYGASRIPVREALQILGAEGVVTIEPNRGAAVPRLSPEQAGEIFELRSLIESHLLEKAEPRHDARSLVRLRSIQAELEHEDGIAGWIEGDRRFHEALYAPSQRPQSIETALRLRARVARFGLPRLGPAARRAGWRSEHRALIRAAEEKDARAAVRVLRSHLDETRALVVAALAAGDH